MTWNLRGLDFPILFSVVIFAKACVGNSANKCLGETTTEMGPTNPSHPNPKFGMRDDPLLGFRIRRDAMPTLNAETRFCLLPPPSAEQSKVALSMRKIFLASLRPINLHLQRATLVNHPQLRR